MRFISKSANLLIILSPGIPGNHLTGQTAKPAVSVRFKDGVADVDIPDLIDLMLRHPGFNADYVSAEDTGNKDPYSSQRTQSEPIHEMTTLQFGTPVKREVKGGKASLSPEIEKYIELSAKKMAAEMLPGMVEFALKKLVSSHEEAKKEAQKEPSASTESAPKKRGRKPSVLKKEEIVVEEEVPAIPIEGNEK